MPFSRTNRIDRRRRVMLDAIASDPELAVESTRVRKRARTRDSDGNLDERESTSSYRDPGYSQAVRRTCQQRMVQLIPVRRGTMAAVLTGMWLLWLGLLVSHYALFVYGPTVGRDQAASVGAIASTTVVSSNLLTTLGRLPIGQLFHLRSAHGIAHWLTCQLWIFTAVAGWLIFQLRRHKLDDYRARYRIWVVLSLIAVFCSFDSTSSALQLLGMSIDGWTRREIGYGGWPLVLATFASLVGVLGIRLCSELRSSPMSVVSWMAGLLVWATSALLGTGLMKTSLSQNSLDFVVGACWLGGVLAVFQAAGIYLRQTYIHAQKRFLQRQGAQLNPIQLRMPKFSLRRNRDENRSDNAMESDANRGRWKLPWNRSRTDQDDQLDFDNQSDSKTTVSKKKSSSDSQESEPSETKPVSKRPSRLFGLVPHRTEQNERLEAEPIRRDDGEQIDVGLTKARGWFGIGGNRVSTDSQSKNAGEAKRGESPTARKEEDAAPSRTRTGWLRGKSTSSSTSTESDSAVAKPKSERKGRNWIPKFGRGKSSTIAEVSAASATSKVSVTQSHATATAKPGNDERTKRSWLSMGAGKSKSSDKVVSKEGLPASTSKSPKRSFMSLFDGLRLKPPADDDVPSARNSPKPIAVQPGQSLPSTRSESQDDDSDESNGNRPLTKADRKKLRRMQQDDRRAA